MNLLDTAAAKFYDVESSYTVVKGVTGTSDQGTYLIIGGDREIIRTPKPITDADEAETLRDQTASRAAVIAVVREIVSPDRLSRAAFIAGCDLRKFENNRINDGKKPSLALLYGLIHAIQEAS